jgi:predicted nucleotidyltransferase
MPKYDVLIDAGEGGKTTVEAKNLEEAKEKAKEWALEGVWEKPYCAEITIYHNEEVVADFYLGVGGCPYEEGCEELICRERGYCPVEDEAMEKFGKLKTEVEDIYGDLMYGDLSAKEIKERLGKLREIESELKEVREMLDWEHLYDFHPLKKGMEELTHRIEEAKTHAEQVIVLRESS